jgi:hypothetical protein
MPTLTKPSGSCEAMAEPDAISICRIIIGVAWTRGMCATK